MSPSETQSNEEEPHVPVVVNVIVLLYTEPDSCRARITGVGHVVEFTVTSFAPAPKSLSVSVITATLSV